jgi:hypothetical protein
MKRSGASWLFWLSIVYLTVAFANLINEFTDLAYIQMVWVVIISLPLVVPPLGRWLNMRQTKVL